MNTSEELNTILKNFTDKLVDINNYQSFIKSSTKRSLEFYHDQLEKQKALNIDGLGDFNSFMCRNIETGEHIHLGYNENSLEDLMRTVQLHNNKQYQWLLVEAYELFEDYIDDLFAFIGLKDHTFWPAKDFGNVSIDELQDKDLTWFEQKVEEKKGKPESIFKQIRLKIKTLNLLDKTNALGVDFVFKIILISKLRHIIVHNRGVIKDLKKFIDLIFKEIGLSISGQKSQQYKNDILFYIGEFENENFVLLLEYEDKIHEKFPLRTYHDRLGKLIEELASYAILLKTLSERYLSGIENWEKLMKDPEEYKKFFASSDLYKYLRQS